MKNKSYGYNMTYKFGGGQYSVQTKQNPGTTIQFCASPVSAQPPGQG
jgi:uncharacterized protein YcfJ